MAFAFDMRVALDLPRRATPVEMHEDLIGRGTDGAGQIVWRWHAYLHTADTLGPPMQIFVCLMGFVVMALSVAGVFSGGRSARRATHRPRGRKESIGARRYYGSVPTRGGASNARSAQPTSFS
jgi:hypothetical protein